MYRNNYEPQPFLRYSQPGFLSSGSLNKIQALDAVPLISSPNSNDNDNFNINQNQWSGLNDVYGYGFRYPNPEVFDENLPTSSVIPPTRRTTRPRTTYTTRERTTVSLSTEAITRPTVELGSGNEGTSTSTESIISPTSSSTPKPTKSPSQLLAQIAQINNSSQGILSQLGKPSRKPGSSGSSLSGQTGSSGSGSSRPSASQLLQQIQKVNSSAQNLLVTLKPKPNTKFLGYEIRDEMVWTTARTTEQEPEIPIVTNKFEGLEESKPILTPVIVLTPETKEETELKDLDMDMEKIETTTLLTEESPTSSESNETMVLVSTSKDDDSGEEDIESRNTDLDLPGTETTQVPDKDDVETTTDPMQEDLDELDNRHEEYDLQGPGSIEMIAMDDDTSEKEVTTAESGESTTEKPTDKTVKAEDRIDEDLTTESPNVEDNELLSETTETVPVSTQTEEQFELEEETDTTTVLPTETTTLEPEEESNVDQELIEFIIIDIISTASALQNVINTIINPISVSLSPEFSLLEALLISSLDSKITTPDAADQISVQILKITSNIGLKRLRSTQILELTQRLTKLGKLLKLSVSNI